MAVRWYRRAALQGNSDAQYNLGVCYANGQGVKPSDTEARRWLSRAALQGDRKAVGALKLLSSKTIGDGGEAVDSTDEGVETID